MLRVKHETGQEMDINCTQEEYDAGMKAWKNGALVQAAFPMLNADEREFLMTGISAQQWDRSFRREGQETVEDTVFYALGVEHAKSIVTRCVRQKILFACTPHPHDSYMFEFLPETPLEVVYALFDMETSLEALQKRCKEKGITLSIEHF